MSVHSSAQAEATNKSPLSEALLEINRTLPVGVELHRSYHYVFPLGKHKKLDLLVLKIHCPEELEGKLNQWRSSIADRLDSVSVLVRRVRGTQGVLNNLRNAFRGRSYITAADSPIINSMIESLCGKPPCLTPDQPLRSIKREDLTDIPWIALDGPGVRDIEDLIHVERKSSGTIMWRTALIDVTDYVSPGSELDRYALRVGSSLYGRRLTVPTLGPELAYDLASFTLGAERPAWIIEGTLKPMAPLLPEKRSTIRYESSYKVRRAMVKNHLCVDPQNILPLPHDSAFARSLSAATEAARILRLIRASKPIPIRVDTTGGLLSGVISELMIESKRLLTDYLGARAPMIYRVHHKPSKRVKLLFHEALNALQIPNDVEHFDNPSEFAGILRFLENHRSRASQALLNDLLDTFLLRTLYSADNYGHYGLRIEGFSEYKARDAVAITNQHQLDAVWTGAPPLSHEEITSRVNLLNERRWQRDERTYALCFLEMLTRKLSLEGSALVGTVSEISPDKIHVEMPGFSKWGILEGDDASGSLRVGAPVTATLRRFDLASARFIFEL